MKFYIIPAGGLTSVVIFAWLVLHCYNLCLGPLLSITETTFMAGLITREADACVKLSFRGSGSSS